jgi:predicted N-formylglutamate amidohydrolase
LLPRQWAHSDEDLQRLKNTHWEYDIGSLAFAEECFGRFESALVYARFSRLLVDPNRPLTSDTLFRKVADGKPIMLNAKVDTPGEHCALARRPPAAAHAALAAGAADRERRLNDFYHPYHNTLRSVATHIDPKLILSIHRFAVAPRRELCPRSPHSRSFTPVYEGSVRPMEIGVLYKTNESKPLADLFFSAFSKAGVSFGCANACSARAASLTRRALAQFKAAINEPWSGLDGFMFAADQVCGPTRQAVMLELRQDLVPNAEWRTRAVDVVESVVKEAFPNQYKKVAAERAAP